MNRVVFAVVAGWVVVVPNLLWAELGVSRNSLHDMAGKLGRTVFEERLQSCSSDNKFTISDKDICELIETVKRAVALNRQIVADNDDPGVIPKDRDRRLFREAMEKLNVLTSNDGVMDWIKDIKRLNKNSPVVPNGDTWTDPITNLKWMVFSNNKISQYDAAQGCKALGNGWRLPDFKEITGTIPRITTSSLRNLDIKAAYWVAWTGTASESSNGVITRQWEESGFVCLHNGYSVTGYDIMKPATISCNVEGGSFDSKALCVQGKP